MRNRAEVAAGRLRRLIREGYFAPDAPLPTLGDLAAVFRVSRATVQTAVHQLSAEGLVKAVRGRGIFVRHPLTWRSQGTRVGLVTKYKVESLGNDPYPARVVRSLRASLKQHGHDLLPVSMRDVGLQDLRSYLAPLRLAGVVLFEIEQGSWVDTIQDLFVPVVSMDFDLYRVGIPSVAFDNLRAGHQAASCLIRHGHTRTVLIRRLWGRSFYHSVMGRSVDLDSVEDDRMRGYQLAMQEAGLTPRIVEIDTADVADYMQSALAARLAPTGVIAMDAELAGEVARYLGALGYAIPGDISLVTFGRHRPASRPSLRITSVDMDYKAMGRRTAALWRETLDGAPPRREILPVRLHMQDSVARVHASRASAGSGS